MSYLPENYPDNEPALLKNISEGDTEAFSRVYHLYNKKVYNTVITYVKDVAETEELVQQIFVKLWERRASLAGVNSFRDYFFILVRNSVFNYFNRLSRQARLADIIRMQTEQTADHEADHLLRQKQYEQLVENAIGSLPDRQKQVYLMAEVEAMDYDTIAEKMQITRLTAKKHMELARRSIREYITRHWGGPTTG